MVAYLIDHRSATSLRRVVEHASTRWGGVKEVAAHVSAAGSLSRFWSASLRFNLKPDAVVCIRPLKAAPRARVEQACGVQLIPDISFDIEGTSHGANPLFLYTEDQLRELTIVQPRRMALDAVVACGYVPPVDRPTWERAGATIVDSDDWIRLALAQIADETALSATLPQYTELDIEALNVSPSVVWVTDKPTPAELTAFWNQRAVLRHGPVPAFAVLVPIEIAQSTEFRTAIVNVMTSRGRFVSPDLVVASMSVGADHLREIGQSWGFTFEKRDRITHHLGRQVSQVRHAPGDVSFVANAGLMFLGLRRRMPGRRTRQLVQFERPMTRMWLESPVSFRGAVPIKLRLTAERYLDAPASSAVAKLYHDAAKWDENTLEFPFIASEPFNFDLRIPEAADLLRAYEADHGISYELSDKGRYARAVLALAGAADIFDSGASVRAVGAMVTPRSRTLIRELKRELAGASDLELDAVARVVGSRMRLVAWPAVRVAAALRMSPKEVGVILERLVGLGLVYRGLLIRCATCGIDSFRAMPESQPAAQCPACGSVARYETAGFGEPQTHYQLNSLLDRAGDNGVLPHLFTLARLRQMFPDLYAMLGVDLTSAGATVGEVDVLAVAGRSVLVGEVKSAAEAFDTRQVIRDFGLSKRLGATHHVVGCIEPLRPSLVKRLKLRAERQGLQLVVIEGERAPGRRRTSKRSSRSRDH